MTTFESRATKKRNHILNTAIELYAQFGAKKVTLDEIADKANVSKVTIYKYFGDRETLFEIIACHIMNTTISQLEMIRETEKSVTTQMIKTTWVLVNLINTGHAGLCEDLVSRTTTCQKKYQEYTSDIRSSIEDLVKAGQNHGMIRTDLSPEMVYYYIDMGLSYFRYGEDYRNKLLTDNAFAKSYMSFIWSNIFIDYSNFDITMPTTDDHHDR